MTALPPTRPLYQHRPEVWVKESWVRFFGLTLQTRMVVVRVANHGLLSYSPSPAEPDDETWRALDDLGEVRWLVAPNEIHNVGLPAFQKEFPEAHTTGCAGHPRRVRGVRFDVLLGGGEPAGAVPWTQSGELDFHVIGGNRFLHEIALFHRPSKTLVVADAVELAEPSVLGGNPPGQMMRWMLGKMGLREGEPCMSPEHNLYCADPDALQASLRVLERWPFDSLVMAHGRIIEGDEARDGLRHAFEQTIAAARKRGPAARAFWAGASRFQ